MQEPATEKSQRPNFIHFPVRFSLSSLFRQIYGDVVRGFWRNFLKRCWQAWLRPNEVFWLLASMLLSLQVLTETIDRMESEFAVAPKFYLSCFWVQVFSL